MADEEGLRDDERGDDPAKTWSGPRPSELARDDPRRLRDAHRGRIGSEGPELDEDEGLEDGGGDGETVRDQ